jgi:hypothetical protein
MAQVQNRKNMGVVMEAGKKLREAKNKNKNKIK